MNSLISIPVKKWLHIFALIFIFALYGCADDSINEGSCVITTEGSNFCIKIVDSNNVTVRNVQTKSTSTVVATLTTDSDEAINNVLVTFTTNIGTLDPASGTALTNENGSASIKLVTGTTIEAGVISAAITLENTSTTTEYTFSVDGSTTTTDTTNNTTDTTDTTDVTDTTDTSDTTDTTDTANVSNSVTGAIEFISSTPANITLRGTGGTGLSEFSTVTFRIIGSDGLPMAGRTVNFSLETDIGGIDIDPISASTTTDGMVSTILQAGNIPTSVRVTASTQITDTEGNTQDVFSQSDQLVISTGLPDQNSMSLSISQYNPEAWNFDGVKVDVIARLADHFNNPVPDGTSVYFTTEGGAIESSCQTVLGECKVVWQSQKPRPLDHRVTILATAIGTESFYDTDSDGKYTLADGEPYIDSNRNNVFDEAFTDTNGNSIFDEPFLALPNGVWDIGETFTDQLNGRYDPGESFVDTGDGVRNDDEPYTDDNPANGQYDIGEAFEDHGDGFWSPDEAFTDALNGIYDPGEPFVDAPNAVYELTDIFIDYNGNGKYDGAGDNPDGETIFVDSNNGNGLYDGSGFNADGESYTEATGNTQFDGPGFNDLPEPYLDANENFKHDAGEMYVDTNNNGSYDATGDGKYNGILCVESNNCSDSKTLHIRDSIILIMSSSAALITAANSHENIVYASNDSKLIQTLTANSQTVSNLIDVSLGRTKNVTVYVTDTAGQIMPAGTSISVNSSVGTLGGNGSHTVENSTGAVNYLVGPTSSETLFDGKYAITFSITDSDRETADYGTIEIEVTSPSGEISTIIISVYT